MSENANPITADVDFEAAGVQHGHLSLPWSSDDSAWGSIVIPIIVVANGSGPTMLMTGANHGDEYEGPIALTNFAREVALSDVQGRIIIIPALNYPAFRAAKRNSPLDGGNMNRSFPGDPRGGPTGKIAHYVCSALLPMTDHVLDIHSGGSTLEFLPFACSHELPDKGQNEAAFEAMKAFRAPYGLQLLELDMVGMFDGVVEDQGKVFVSTELGGGGSTTAASVAIARRGIENMLRHFGILKGDLEGAETRLLSMPDGDCFIRSEVSGLVEWAVDLGDVVKKGDLVARVHNLERSDVEPVSHVAKKSGIVLGRRFPGQTRFGDTLAVIAVDGGQG